MSEMRGKREKPSTFRAHSQFALSRRFRIKRLNSVPVNEHFAHFKEKLSFASCRVLSHPEEEGRNARIHCSQKCSKAHHRTIRNKRREGFKNNYYYDN